MSRFLRYLRIAFSGSCVIACVLLIVLWVRSYSWIDIATGPISATSRAATGSSRGWVNVTWNHPLHGFTHWKVQHNSIASIEEFEANALARGEGIPPRNAPSFGFSTMPSGSKIFQLPHWLVLCLLLISAVAAAAPWLRWRFSLRTLLIATTLVAMGLGAIAYCTR